MWERRRPGQGDITGESHGDFTDWDNPEDRWDDEGAPLDYDDAEADPHIPHESDPDYDLSEAHGYSNWESSEEAPFPGWLIAGAAILLIIAILIPLFLRIS